MSVVDPVHVSTLERSAAADLWRNTLSKFPSLLGRLIYLAQIWDPESQVYFHHGLESIFGREESDRALRFAHTEVFGQLLAFHLTDQKDDLDLYLRALPDDLQQHEIRWLVAKGKDLIPASARSVERILFLSNFGALLKLRKDA